MILYLIVPSSTCPATSPFASTAQTHWFILPSGMCQALSTLNTFVLDLFAWNPLVCPLLLILEEPLVKGMSIRMWIIISQ